MAALARMFRTAAMAAFLVVWVVTLMGCAQAERRYERATVDCDVTPGLEVSIGDGGWRARPTLGC